jgi:cytidylate kinase
MSESHTRVDSRDESVPLGTSTKPRQAMAVPQMLSSRDARGHAALVRARNAATTVSVMSRVLVTGMSGAGKSTVLDELRRRGLHAVDTDYEGWEQPDGDWDLPRMDRLLAGHQDVIVSGTVENQVRFYDRFEHIVLLSAPLDVLMQRVADRTNNSYGKSSAEREEIARYFHTVEPLLRRGRPSS